LTIAVAAGKGGTGKTLLSTSLALSLNESYPGKVQLLDCDVEEPNADLLMRSEFDQSDDVHILVPQVDLDKCSRCGACAKKCEFAAIAVINDAVLTFPELCAGCGVCAYVCPTRAIEEVKRKVGTVSVGTAGNGLKFVQGRVKVGETRSGPVTKATKKLLRDDMINIVDSPPGTACPMQETVEGSDFCILITERTPFGLSDLEAAVETCKALEVPVGIVINRDRPGFDGLDEYCTRSGIPVLLRIPEKREIAEAYSKGVTLTEAFPEWGRQLIDMFENIASQCSQGEKQNAKS